MKTLKLTPRGNVTRDVDYGNRVVSFENGSQQVQRTWQSPRITFSIECVGDIDEKKYLQDFIDSVSGNYEAFWWEYDGTKYPCRFADSKISFTEIRGYGGVGVLGYKISLAIMVCKKGEYKE